MATLEGTGSHAALNPPSHREGRLVRPLLCPHGPHLGPLLLLKGWGDGMVPLPPARYDLVT